MSDLTIAEIEALLFVANQGVVAMGSVQIGRMNKLADFESGFAKLQALTAELAKPAPEASAASAEPAEPHSPS